MKNNFSVFVKLFLFSFLIDHVKSANLTLDLVQVIFRHGARTPSPSEAKIFSITDPRIYGDSRFDQLTNEGKQQTYHLGTLLRKEYNEYLGDYHPETLHAYSSQTSRTKMSMQNVLAGLFPPSMIDYWNPKLNWRPIAYEQAHKKCDVTVHPVVCPRYDSLRVKVFPELEDINALLLKHKYIIDHIEKSTGYPFWKSDLCSTIGWTYGILLNQKRLNITVPEWCTDEVFDALTELITPMMDSICKTIELQRMMGGPTIKQMIKNIKLNDELEMPKKIYLYSSHDLTIYAFMKIQKVYISGIPPFSCAVLVEKFHDDNDRNYIRIRYWDGVGEDFVTLKIDNCEDYCPFEDYLRNVEDAIPTDEEVKYMMSDDL